MTLETRNLMLEGIRGYTINGSNKFYINAYKNGVISEANLVARAEATFNPAVGGLCQLASNVNLTIPPGTTVTDLQIAKGGETAATNLFAIENKSITSQAFPDGGILIITTTDTFLSVT